MTRLFAQWMLSVRWLTQSFHLSTSRTETNSALFNDGLAETGNDFVQLAMTVPMNAGLQPGL